MAVNARPPSGAIPRAAAQAAIPPRERAPAGKRLRSAWRNAAPNSGRNKDSHKDQATGTCAILGREGPQPLCGHVRADDSRAGWRDRGLPTILLLESDKLPLLHCLQGRSCQGSGMSFPKNIALPRRQGD